MDVSYRTICDPPAFSTATKCYLPFSPGYCIAAATDTKLQIYTFDKETGFNLIWEKNFWAKIFKIISHRVGEYDVLILGCNYNKIVVLAPVGDIDLEEVEFHSFNVCSQSECKRNQMVMIKDPNDTCIALFIGGEMLLFLTLCQPNDFSQNERPKIELGQHSGWKIITGAILHKMVHDYNPPFFRVMDIIFLEGYNRPTLALIHEPIPTYSVRLPIQKPTICVSLITPLLVNRKNETNSKTSSWTSRCLPHNYVAMIPVLAPYGGFIVLTKNAIIYMTHTSGIAYALNSLARIDDECPFEISGQCQEPHEIYSPVYCVLDQHNILITVDQHYPAILTLHDNGIDIIGMTLCIDTNFEFHPSLFLSYDDGLVFGGSTIQDSHMFSINLCKTSIEPEISDEFQLTESQIDLYKRFYDELPKPISREIVESINISIVGTIYQIGTVTASTPFVNFDDATTLQGFNNEAISMAMGCGFKKSGCLQYLRNALSPNIISTINVNDIISIFTSDLYDYVLLSQKNSTIVAKFVDSKIEFSKQNQGDFDTSQPTIAAGDFKNYFIQITSLSVNLIRNGTLIHSFMPETEISSSIIKSAKISENCIILNLTGFGVMICTDVVDNKLEFKPIQFSFNNKQTQIYRTAIYKDYIFMLQNNHNLHIYSIPENRVIYSCEKFKYLNDAIYPQNESQFNTAQLNSTITPVIDLNVIDIGKIPVLVMIMKEGNVILYFVHKFSENQFRFKRIKNRKFTSTNNPSKTDSIIPFKNINGYNGAYICSENPMFIIGECGYPRIISSTVGNFFAQIHDKFIVGEPNEIKVADFENLNTRETHIIGGCVVQRVNVGQTIRSLTFAAPWHAIIFFSSYPVVFSHENEPDIDPEAKLKPHYQRTPTPPRELEMDGLPIAYEEQYDLNIITSSGITKALSLEKHEYGNCVSFIRTSDNYLQENSNLSEYLAIGTGYMCHEERLMRGRLAIYKGTIVQSDKNGVNEYQLQELFSKVFLAPINVITELDGYIATFVGGQLQMIMFINESQHKVASQLNGHFVASQLLSLKNLLFYVDMFKGCQLIRWRTYGHKLITMAKDFLTYQPLSGIILSQKKVIGTGLFDNFGNAQLFDIDEYAIPIDAFVRRSVFHIGCRAISSGFFPIKSQINANEIAGHFGWFVSDHGKFGIFSPISDEASRRKLCVVQSLYEKTLNGFSHFEYRSGKFYLLENEETIIETPRLVVDMDLLLDFMETQPDLQKQCIKTLGGSSSEIISIIGDIYSISKIFE